MTFALTLIVRVGRFSSDWLVVVRFGVVLWSGRRWGAFSHLGAEVVDYGVQLQAAVEILVLAVYLQQYPCPPIINQSIKLTFCLFKLTEIGM